jgi:radical SAM-linked protein
MAGSERCQREELLMRLRIIFAKQGALRYTGHLDLHRLWERAARRAELPLAYSQGFHPQPKLAIAAALPLGFSSRCEILDMRLEHEISLDGLCEKLQETLPTGIQVASIESVDEKLPALQTLVASAEYLVTLTEAVDSSELKRRIDSVMGSESIMRERRGKTYDLRPLIEELHLQADDRVFMRLAAREGATGRPEEVLDALGIAFEGTRIERTQIIFKQTE